MWKLHFYKVDQILGLEPVPELTAKMNLRPDEICLAKSAYGLIDAPFLWFQALRIISFF